MMLYLCAYIVHILAFCTLNALSAAAYVLACALHGPSSSSTLVGYPNADRSCSRTL